MRNSGLISYAIYPETHAGAFAYRPLATRRGLATHHLERLALSAKVAPRSLDRDHCP